MSLLLIIWTAFAVTMAFITASTTEHIAGAELPDKVKIVHLLYWIFAPWNIFILLLCIVVVLCFLKKNKKREVKVLTNYVFKKLVSANYSDI